VKGDKSLLIMLLRSYRELGRNDRDCIADYLEGRFNRKRGRPRGIVLTEQRLKRMRAAAVVRIAKQSLKENKERYSHEKIVDRTVEMLSERGVRLTRAIRTALEDAGCEFIREDDVSGPSMRMRKRPVKASRWN
jgi:hypothetical protein